MNIEKQGSALLTLILSLKMQCVFYSQQQIQSMPAVHSNLSKISFSLSLSLLKLSLHQIFYGTCVQTTNDANTRNYHRIQPYGNTTLEKFLLFTRTTIFLIHCKTLENWDLRQTMPTTELCVVHIVYSFETWSSSKWLTIVFSDCCTQFEWFIQRMIFSIHCIVNIFSMPTHCWIEISQVVSQFLRKCYRKTQF